MIKKNDTLTNFVKKYESIITVIALFTALAAFFTSSVTKGASQTLSDKFIPFISTLIVITLLIHLYVKSRAVRNPEKGFYVFRSLILLFLFFSIMYIFEFWTNFIELIGKLIILLVMVHFFLWVFERGIKKEWFLKKIFYILLVYVFLMMSTLLVLTATNCILNPYIIFTLLSLLFSLTFSMLMLLIYGYTAMFDVIVDLASSTRKRDKKLIKTGLRNLLIIIPLAALIFYIIIKYVPLLWLTKLLTQIIFLPRILICGS
jgi:hypothetical protein